MAPFTVERVSWQEGQDLLRPVREEVFVVEQAVPAELEWNEGDDECEHVVALDEARRPIGTGRIDGEGRIGRMAVVAARRGEGVGAALLGALVDLAVARGLRVVTAHAQTRAIGFYEREGFVAEGDEFMEAGIPHRLMRRLLAGPPRGD